MLSWSHQPGSTAGDRWIKARSVLRSLDAETLGTRGWLRSLSSDWRRERCQPVRKLRSGSLFLITWVYVDLGEHLSNIRRICCSLSSFYCLSSLDHVTISVYSVLDASLRHTMIEISFNYVAVSI